MFKILLLFLSMLCLQSLVWAEKGDLINPDRLLEEALLNNLEIKSIKFKINSQKSRVSAEGILMDTRLNFEIRRLPTTRPFDLQDVEMYMVYISQEIPFWGKLKLKREIEETNLSKIEAEYEKLKLDIAFKVYSNFFKYYYLVKKAEILDSKIKLLNQLLGNAEIRYTTNSMMRADIIKIRSELIMIKNESEMNLVEIKNIKSEINSITGRDADSDIGYPAEYTIDSEVVFKPDYLLSLIRLRPESKSIEKDIDSIRKRVELNKYNYSYPDFMVSGGYGLSPIMKDGLFFMFSFNLPWLNPRNRYEIRMEEEMVREKEAMYLNDIREADAKVKSLYNKLLKLSSVLKNTEEVLEISKERLYIEKSQYESGMGYLLNLMDALNDFYNRKMEYQKAKLEYSMTYIDLLIGCGLYPDKFIK